MLADWTHILATPEQPITMSILDDHKLVITQGTNKILESLSLWESKTWIKGVRKGSALLMMLKSPLNDSYRKIRFRFRADAGLSAEDQAIEAAAVLAAYFHFEKEYSKESFSKFEQEPVTGQKLLLSDMGKLMVNGDIAQLLGDLYTRTHFPKEQLRHMLTLCLTDPNFPGFVVEVEKLLNSMNSISGSKAGKSSQSQ